MEAKIKLTKTMLDKSIIDANKSVCEFLDHDFGMNYNDKFFTEEWYDTEKERTMRNAFSVVGEYADGTEGDVKFYRCLLYTSPSPRDRTRSRMPSSA